MAFPILGSSLGGILITSLTAFFATKIPVILAALGMTYGVQVGLEGITAQITTGITGAIGAAGTVNWGGQSVDLLGMAGSAGLFKAADIIVSGFAALVAMQTGKVVMRAVSK